MKIWIGKLQRQEDRLIQDGFVKDKSEKRESILQSRRGSVLGKLLGFIACVSLLCMLDICCGCKMIEMIEKVWEKISGPEHTCHKIVPCKEIVDDLRVLWSYERNYAYRHKELASSIVKMGDGAGVGKDGFVLSSSLWEARIDDNTNAVPVVYKIANVNTGRKESVGAYRFGIIPALTSTGEIDRFSAILVAVPNVPADDDFCFIALCGPVNLQNDFSFDRKWPVFQLNAKEKAIREIRDMKSISIEGLRQRLTSGDLKPYVRRDFSGLYYPKDVK